MISTVLVWLQALFALLLYLEAPGPIDPDTNSLKSISDGIRQHNGFAAAAFACEIGSLAFVLMALRPYSRWIPDLLLLVTVIGDLGVIFAPDDQKGDGHNYFAACAMGGPLFLTALLVYYEPNWSWGAYMLLAGIVGIVGAISSVGAWQAGIGPFEVVLLSSLWSTWMVIY